MSKASFKDLPYDIYLRIANDAVEDFVDDSLPFLPLRLICPKFTPIISQCIMNKWAQSKPTFHVLLNAETDQLERFLRMCKWTKITCKVTHLSFTGDEQLQTSNQIRETLCPIKPKHRYHQCVSVLTACRKTLKNLHLQNGVNRRHQDCILFDDWNSQELNMGFPALESLTITLWYLPLLPALLVNSAHLTSTTFVDTGIHFDRGGYFRRYPQLSDLIHSVDPLTRHTIQNIAFEAGYGRDFRCILTLLNRGIMTARHATMLVQRANPASSDSDLLHWRRHLPNLERSRFFRGCTTIAFACSEGEIGTEVLSKMAVDFRSRLRWTGP